jgi:hypothetical protein
MAPLYAPAATPSQKLAAAARRERERKIAAHARPDTPIAHPPALVRPQPASSLRRLPISAAAPCPSERQERPPAPTGTWFWIVEEINPSPPREPSLEEIQGAVDRHFQAAHLKLISARRDAGVLRSRQIAMFLAKNLTSYSLRAIGSKFGGRDHTTVLYAVRRIAALQARDQRLAADLGTIRRTLAMGTA